MQRLSHGARQFFEQAGKQFRVGIEHRPGLPVFFNTAAFDHEVRQRPRRAGKAEQGGPFTEGGPGLGQGLDYILQALRDGFDLEAVDISSRLQKKVHRDAAFVAEPIALAQSLGHNEDIAKKDGSIKPEPADRLERHFGG